MSLARLGWGFLMLTAFSVTAFVLFSGDEAPAHAQAAASAQAAIHAQGTPPAQADDAISVSQAQAEPPSTSADPAKAASPAAPSASAAAAASAPAPAAAAKDGACDPGAASESSLVQDLQKEKQAVDAKMKELDAREADLKAREQAVQEELKRIQAARDDIAKIEQSHAQENEERVGKVVETMESMSPKAASALLVSLDEGLAVAAMSNLSSAKLSKILNVMEPAKSARLTELLAGVVRARKLSASNDAAATTPMDKKGGETNDPKIE